MSNIQLGEGFETLSIVYNGKKMTKAELMMYLYDISDLRREIDDILQKTSRPNPQIAVLKEQKKRRSIYMPYMEKPSGLSALSKRKKEAYQQWLAEAPQREAERKRKEVEEDARIAGIQKQIDKLNDEELALAHRGVILGEKFKELMLLQILALEYRKDNIPEQLLGYLWSGRAHTLTDAINLYHEEKHRMEMRMIAEQQLMETRRAQQQQLDIAWQQMEVLKEQRAMQQQTLEAAEEARSAAKSAEFMSYISLVQDILYRDN